jgi:hypothetical protein
LTFRLVAFAGGTVGQWEVRRVEPVRGNASGSDPAVEVRRMVGVAPDKRRAIFKRQGHHIATSLPSVAR